MEYKEITFNGRKMFYALGQHDYHGTITYFYSSEPTIIKFKKYLFFGEEEERKEYKLLFVLYCDIESPKYTKEQIRERLEREIKIIDREEEIKRGEII
jgi:hypothetical protein